VPDRAPAWYRAILDQFELRDDERVVLELAREAFGRYEEARDTIAEHGLLVRDRFNGLKANPACSVERDARAGVLAGLRQLGIREQPEALAPLSLAAGRKRVVE
jgi:phage terminase small subunit